MLDECLEGYAARPMGHNVWVYMGAKRFMKLPKGKGQLPKNSWRKQAGKVPVEIGIVRSLVTFFEINPTCASKHFEEFGKRAVEQKPV